MVIRITEGQAGVGAGDEPNGILVHRRVDLEERPTLQTEPARVIADGNWTRDRAEGDER